MMFQKHVVIKACQKKLKPQTSGSHSLPSRRCSCKGPPSKLLGVSREEGIIVYKLSIIFPYVYSRLTSKPNLEAESPPRPHGL